MTHVDDSTKRGRLPRSARRAQLMEAAQSVFVESGYHSAAMDEIAERAHVSKPVLYQHFPGKLDLYLALLEQHTREVPLLVREAIESTSDNSQRVAAAIGAFFAFVEREDAGAQREGLTDVVRHHHDGQRILLPQTAYERVHVSPDAGIEGAERLVQQQDARPLHESLRDRQSLLHSA